MIKYRKQETGAVMEEDKKKLSMYFTKERLQWNNTLYSELDNGDGGSCPYTVS